MSVERFEQHTVPEPEDDRSRLINNQGEYAGVDHRPDFLRALRRMADNTRIFQVLWLLYVPGSLAKDGSITQEIAGISHESRAVRSEWLLRSAAEALRQRDDFKRAFTAERIEFLANEISHVDVDEIMQVISQRSGIPEIELSKRLSFIDFIFYSNEIRDEVAKDGIAQDHSEDAAGMAGINGSLYINLSYVFPERQPDEDIESWEAGTRNELYSVLVHEFMHLFNQNHEGYSDTSISYALYEGVTDALAGDVRRRLNGLGKYLGPDKETAGYIWTGPTFAAQIFIESLGGFDGQNPWSEYLEGFPKLIERFNAQHGEGSFEAVSTSPLSIDAAALTTDSDEHRENVIDMVRSVTQKLSLHQLLSFYKLADRERLLAAVNERNHDLARVQYDSGEYKGISWTLSVTTFNSRDGFAIMTIKSPDGKTNEIIDITIATRPITGKGHKSFLDTSFHRNTYRLSTTEKSDSDGRSYLHEAIEPWVRDDQGNIRANLHTGQLTFYKDNNAPDDWVLISAARGLIDDYLTQP